MYVVKDGDIIPLNDLHAVKTVPPEAQQKEDAEKQMAATKEHKVGNIIEGVPPSHFTVIPLIIPITVKTYDNITHTTTTERPFELEGRLGNLDPNCTTSKEFKKITQQADVPILHSVKEKQIQSINGPLNAEIISSTPSGLVRKNSITISLTTSKSSTLSYLNSKINDISSTTGSIIDLTNRESIYDSGHGTVTENDEKILGKVLQDVQELINHKSDENISNREGALCKVNGDWDSDAAGVQFQIEFNTIPQLMVVKVQPREPPVEDGFLNGPWNVTAEVPYNQSSLIVIIAIASEKKKIASFIGECRICEGTETITGNWMIGRSSKNCKDQQESYKILSDVLRKNNIRMLQKSHLAAITSSSRSHTTTEKE